MDPARPEAAPRRVLLIDDELTIRMALRRFFSRMGWEVEEASDGEAGLARILDGVPESGGARYDVIVCDLRMPGVSGIEVHDRLLASRPAALPRIVFTTGDVMSPEAADFVERASSHVLEKPFELAALRALVHRIVIDADPSGPATA
jgi:CheY-like chemotaxis protein